MGDVLLTTGKSYLPNIDIANPNKSNRSLFDNIENLGRGFFDENIIGMSAKAAAEFVFNERPDLYKVDKNYNPFYDPQLEPYKEFMGNFLHSKSKDHTSYLIDRFKNKMAAIEGDPSYMIGRILGGLTDPSSLFMFSKGAKFLLSGSRISRGLKAGAMGEG